ncbi:hypothetical protein EXIGLDRAFT_732736 [Exidia glandulosa HHB12029]|uniref:Amidohydrolase 3 domain-containing protein n=1 Tax=Exidia glandulosa HHB12029 TaxID=1314781 RepID=A0A165BF76_EXIGL|nr:hypothetical protein EXIGLDRAFT_732736 [Exidia glandulosa HHB12029]
MLDADVKVNEKTALPRVVPVRPPLARAQVSRGRVRAFVSAICIAFFVVLSRRSGKVGDDASSYTLCTEGGARIYTVDASKPLVECIVVDGKEIVDTGGFAEVTKRNRGRQSASDSGRLLDALKPKFPLRYVPSGAIVVPGLSDAHAHILQYGQSRQLDVRDAKSPEDVVTLVREYILARPDVLKDTSQWVVGMGFDHTTWPGGRWPTASVFEQDDIVKGRPIVIHSKDAHAVWVSQTILDTFCPCDDVSGGMVTRDPDGKANGVFVDDAQVLIPEPSPTHKQREQWFNTTMSDAVAHGLTAIHDAGLEPSAVIFFKRMADQGKLPIRIYAMRWYEVNGTYWGDKEEILVGHADNRLSVRSVKIFTDGALRSGGAALYEPYTDNPSTRGVLRISQEEMETVIPKFLKDGWQVNTHCIGDRANGIFLDVIGGVPPEDVRALRPRVEHAQIVALPDLKRFGELGVIASVQPTHATDDMWYAEDRLGPERIRGTYAWRSLLDGGASLALGSDMPVEGVSPFAGFYAAITRLTPEGESPHGPGGWFPQECITRAEALKGMTLDAAYASFTENVTGSLEPGKRADFVILDTDIMTVPVTEILKVKVVTTAVDGKAVFGRI